MPHLELNAFTLLLVQIVVIVTASRLLALALKPLGQPLVIAEVLAGILLGPSLLGNVAPGVMELLFPPASQAGLKLVSQLGLVLFMFLIGLETDLRQLAGRGRSAVIISFSSIAVPFGLGAVLALVMYPRWSSPSVPFLSFMLFIGIAMSVTAFPVLARILSERQLLGGGLGNMAIACAAVGDVIAWCLLAVVVALTGAGGLSGAFVTLALAAAFIAAVILVLRPFLRRFAQRSAGPMSHGGVVITVLLLLACSAATELIGVHALFGAFLFGVALPKDHRFASALGGKLETVAVALLLPLFFALSGLRTQLGLLSSATDWAMTLVVIAVATLGKLGGTTAGARLTGVSWREAGALGILLNTRGLVELVVLNIGYDLGVINSTVFTMLVLMALVTTFATSPLIRWVYPVKELAQKRIDSPSAPHGRGGLLICVADAASGNGLARVSAALRDPAGATEATALHLYPSTDRPSVELEHQQQAPALGPLGPLLVHAQQLGQPVRPLTFASSEFAADICRTAEAKQATLVLLASATVPWAQMSATVKGVTARCTSPVAVLVNRGLPRIERVVIALGSDAHDGAAFVLSRYLTGARPRPLRLADPTADLGDADLVLVGAGPRAAQLDRLLQSSRASVLWVHPARSVSMANAALALLETEGATASLTT